VGVLIIYPEEVDELRHDLWWGGVDVGIGVFKGFVGVEDGLTTVA
jgi:hypothetical protein